jgi:hypothetical protein
MLNKTLLEVSPRSVSHHELPLEFPLVFFHRRHAGLASVALGVAVQAGIRKERLYKPGFHLIGSRLETSFSLDRFKVETGCFRAVGQLHSPCTAPRLGEDYGERHVVLDEPVSVLLVFLHGVAVQVEFESNF